MEGISQPLTILINLIFRKMKWYIGQPIVAIINTKCGHIKKGQEFTIKGLRRSWCTCDSVQIDIGLIPKSPLSICGKCRKETENGGIAWKSEICFSPLDQDISELTEILEQPIIKTLEN